jgi:hypothetical protein
MELKQEAEEKLLIHSLLQARPHPSSTQPKVRVDTGQGEARHR